MIFVALLIPAAVVGLLLAGRELARPGGSGVLGRFGPALAGIAAVAVFGFVLAGVESSAVPVMAPVVLLPLVGLAFTLARRGPALAEPSWKAPTDAAPLRIGPGESRAPDARLVARALGRVEARELARSPWFGVGVGFCFLLFVAFGGIWATEDSGAWQGFIRLAPWLAHPLVGLVVLATHRSTTRAARDGADELFDACPTSPLTRTVGILLTAWVPVAVLATFFALLGLTVSIRSPRLHGSVGIDSAADVAAALVLGIGGVALGVALGRWVRLALAPVVVVVAIAVATLSLNGVGGSGWHPLTYLSTAPVVDETSPVFTERPMLWHLLWITGLVAVVSLVAVGRHRRDRAVAWAMVAAVAVVLAAGIGATRPLPSASAAQIADLVANPEDHQVCVGASDPVAVCGYPFHRELLELVAERVGPIAAALPDGAAPLTLRQVYDRDLDDLPPEVRRLLDVDDLVRPRGEVPLGFSVGLADAVDDPGFDVAFAAIGLPLEPNEDHVPTVIAGQARGVVAIWLATRGLDDADAARASTSAEPGSADPFVRGSLEPLEHCSTPSVVWSAQDLEAARAMLAMPETVVSDVVTRDWDRWKDPGTGTDQLMAALGLPGVGPFDHVEPRPGQPC